METINLVSGEHIANLHYFGEGVLYYSVFNRETQDSRTDAHYYETKSEALEALIKDAADMIEMGWRIAE